MLLLEITARINNTAPAGSPRKLQLNRVSLRRFRFPLVSVAARSSAGKRYRRERKRRLRGNQRARGEEREGKLTSWRRRRRKKEKEVPPLPAGVRSTPFLFPFHSGKTNSRDFNDTRMIYVAGHENEGGIFLKFRRG